MLINNCLPKKTCVAIALLLSPWLLFADNNETVLTAQTANKKPMVLTIEDAVLLTLRNNPQVKQDKIKRIVDKFALVVANYAFQPQYQLNASYTYTHGINGSTIYNTRSLNITPQVNYQNHYGTQFAINSANPLNNGTFNPQITFNVTQPLIRGFGKPVVDAALNDAKDSEIVNQLNFKNSIMTAVAQVINDYLTLVQDYGNLSVDQLSLKSYQQTVTNDRTLIDAGQMARSDIIQAQAQVESQQATIQSDLSSIDNDRAQLLADLGLPPQTNIIIPKNIDFDAMAKQMMGGLSVSDIIAGEKTALSNNVSYQVNLITIRTLRRSLLLAKDSRRWQLNVVASESRGGNSTTSGSQSIFNSNEHAETVGVNLGIPIDDVPAQQAEIQARVALESAGIALNEQKRQLLESVDTQYRTVLSNLRSLQLGRQALVLQKQTVDIAEQKQVAGRISTFEVITTKKDLTTQAQTVVQSEIAYLKSIVAYQQTLGNILQPWHIEIQY